VLGDEGVGQRVGVFDIVDDDDLSVVAPGGLGEIAVGMSGMRTGYSPTVAGRNTSARNTIPSSIVIGTSQSMVMGCGVMAGLMVSCPASWQVSSPCGQVS
jgi:hypothetical protein